MKQGASPSEASQTLNAALKRIARTNGVQAEDVPTLSEDSQ